MARLASLSVSVLPYMHDVLFQSFSHRPCRFLSVGRPVVPLFATTIHALIWRLAARVHRPTTSQEGKAATRDFRST